IVNISSGAAIGPGRGPYRDPAAGARGGTCYGAEKAALERFTQGLASEVYQYGVSVTCVSPSQIVPTPGTVYHRLVKSIDEPPGGRPRPSCPPSRRRRTRAGRARARPGPDSCAGRDPTGASPPPPPAPPDPPAPPAGPSRRGPPRRGGRARPWPPPRDRPPWLRAPRAEALPCARPPRRD